MKKIKTIFLIFLFFLCFIYSNERFLQLNKHNFNNALFISDIKICSLKYRKDRNISRTSAVIDDRLTNLRIININNNDDKKINERVYKFEYNDKKYKFNSFDLKSYDEYSDIQKMILKDRKFFKDTFEIVKNFGLSKREIVKYFYPEVEYLIEKLCKEINIKEIESYVELEKNTCEIKFVDGKSGVYLNQEKFYNDLYKCIEKNDNYIDIKLETFEFNNIDKIRENFRERGVFKTNFSSSSAERKHNIKLALSKFDGYVLNEGEVLRFNTVTGERNEKNGYKKAKIISNGNFVEGYGGGVCQVSTTLYNACILSGLEILEVNSHSLPVSYIEPSFDAMVNAGSSDLVVRNNSGGKILITCSFKNDDCKIKIFGKEKDFTVEKLSEITKILPATEDEIETDFSKYNIDKEEVENEKRIKFGNNGYCSNGYLIYKKTDGKFIKKVKIRENKYMPTKGIILRKN